MGVVFFHFLFSQSNKTIRNDLHKYVSEVMSRRQFPCAYMEVISATHISGYDRVNGYRLNREAKICKIISTVKVSLSNCFSLLS